jgi:TetR/AcrR family transcriptional regulator, transcriptional repressor for nem operon
VAARVTAALQRVESLLRTSSDLANPTGSIVSGIDADASACTLLCLQQGLRVIGKTGRTRAR